VAEVLALAGNAFEFDLLTRKAAEMLGVREEVLRGQARKTGRAPTRPARETPAPRATAAADMRSIAEFGVLAVATAYPELREEILAGGALSDFEDQRLAGIAAEVCGSGDEPAQALITQRLSAAQQNALSARMLEPSLENPVSARQILADYRGALARLRGAREVKGLVAAAAAAGESEALAAAQAIILHRREQQKATK
jgi:hypothetical protein